MILQHVLYKDGERDCAVWGKILSENNFSLLLKIIKKVIFSSDGKNYELVDFTPREIEISKKGISKIQQSEKLDPATSKFDDGEY